MSAMGADDALPCANGCGWSRFGGHRTCCTGCRGPTGPHAHDCAVKNRRLLPACASGCGRPAFRHFRTCCKQCESGRGGEHADDCWQKCMDQAASACTANMPGAGRPLPQDACFAAAGATPVAAPAPTCVGLPPAVVEVSAPRPPIELRCGNCGAAFAMAIPEGASAGMRIAAACPQCGTSAERTLTEADVPSPAAPAPAVAVAVPVAAAPGGRPPAAVAAPAPAVAVPVAAAAPAVPAAAIPPVAMAMPVGAGAGAVGAGYGAFGGGGAPALIGPNDVAQVHAAGFTNLLPDGNKGYREYMFRIRVGSVEDQVQCRFSQLRGVHQTLCTTNLAFPSRHLFSDMRTVENAQRRSTELERYLQDLLNRWDNSSHGAVTTSGALHAALRCGPRLSSALNALGEARRRAHQERQQAEAMRLQAIRQQQFQDRDFAQRVNHQPGAVTMFFPRQLTFELRNKMFSWRDQVMIKGPGGLDWFGMLRASSIFSLRDTEVIATLSGEPLLALHRQFSWMHYEYRLERISASGVSMPVCVITRRFQLFAPAIYTVQMLGHAFGGQIRCEGRWLEDFVFWQDGAPACRVRRRPFSIPECYDVVIEPNRDVLLFLGIACAVDHIHHEIEERNR
eukprot:TRINITY_DN23988_c0_g1_i1.p1 TRINITY_DN23988_c0_g1~~TRINITY_DN23988_c0_g1_i1.p1  ORF type:complete len:643 (+),score=118.70 TRINITY_DN23988_c0_g1_i1:64-1929(+)